MLQSSFNASWLGKAHQKRAVVTSCGGTLRNSCCVFVAFVFAFLCRGFMVGFGSIDLQASDSLGFHRLTSLSCACRAGTTKSNALLPFLTAPLEPNVDRVFPPRWYVAPHRDLLHLHSHMAWHSRGIGLQASGGSRLRFGLETSLALFRGAIHEKRVYTCLLHFHQASRSWWRVRAHGELEGTGNTGQWLLADEEGGDVGKTNFVRRGARNELLECIEQHSWHTKTQSSRTA